MSGPGKEPRSHAMTAALLGGAVGAAAAVGAAGVWSARAIARRNGAAQGCDGMNAVMKTAATACELSHGTAAAAGEARRKGGGED
jgi:hypothetical protein